jgi:putative membrane-bound dehydrogenase-like protein
MTLFKRLNPTINEPPYQWTQPLFSFIFSLSIIVTYLPMPAYSQNNSPEVALSKMQMADGLKATIVASEPLVRQPVAIDFDDRGRLWVIQYLQYPNPAGLNRIKVDRFSRTQYDRIPEPPPRGPNGADKITILEDKNGDGRADKAHDFISGLNLSTGFAFGDQGVYVLQAPYLLHYKDANQDDIPDSDPQVLLTGFGMDDAHSLANSLTWGNDGWLYGLQGSTVTAKIRGIEFQQGIWRYHPPTDRFELYAEGGGNMWGLDLDRSGNLIASTNFGPHIALDVLQDAYYWKQFGKHGPLHNPFAYGHFDHMRHENPKGGHVTAGGIFYQADQWPLKYRGKYIGANVLSHWVSAFDLIPDGSTFKTKQTDLILNSHDPWFAPNDLALGVDGNIYVADWHDERMAHPDPDADWDRTNGRIYMIKSIADQRPGMGLIDDISKLGTAELVDGLSSANLAIVCRSRRILKERHDKESISLLKSAWDHPNTTEQIRREILWTMISQQSQEIKASIVTDDLLKDCLKQSDAVIRRSAIQFIGDRNTTVSTDLEKALTESIQKETDLRILGQYAATSGRLGSIVIWESVVKRSSSVSNDPQLALRLWWSSEKIARSHLKQMAESLEQLDHENIPVIDQTIIPRFIQMLANQGGDFAGDWLAKIIKSSKSLRNKRLAIILESLRGASPKLTGKMWSDYITKAYGDESGNIIVWEIAARMRQTKPREDASKISVQGQSSIPDKTLAAYLITAADLKWEDWSSLCLSSLKAHSPITRAAAWQAMGRLMSDREIDVMINEYPASSNSMKAQIRDLLLTRPDACQKLLESVESGRIPKADFDLNQVARMESLGSLVLKEKAFRIWGRVQSATPEERLAEVRRLNNDLRAADGDLAKGRVLFTNHCGRCHKLNGEGNAIGPELTGANRTDRQWLLTSLVDPSGVVRKEYQSQILEMKDGRVMDVLIISQTGGLLKVIDSQGKEFQVIAGEVIDRRDSPTSLMADGLYKLFRPQELRDLFAYLQKVESSK